MRTIKFIIFCFLFISCFMSLQARKQWTEKQAAQWEKRVGVIKGFNVLDPAYPGMTKEEILAKAKELGFNSFRAWYPGTPEVAIQKLKDDADLAEKYGFTISPVLCVPIPQAYWDSKGTDEQSLQQMKEYTQKVIGAVADDKRIVLWDIKNEPGGGEPHYKTRAENYTYTFQAVAKIAEWAYEMNPTQAISSSISWTATANHLTKEEQKIQDFAGKVESMMDVHNFHNYQCSGNSDDQSSGVQKEIDKLMQLGKRPIICTECLTRHNNSGLSRTLAVFAKNNVHFYQWGLYKGDTNWDVKWAATSYDPYNVDFHNMLTPDGEPIDSRDLDLVRNYKFTNGEEYIPEAEYTDKWESQRAWQWMATGPVKGKTFCSASEAILWLNTARESKNYNSINVRFQYASYKQDAKVFFSEMETILSLAQSKGITVLATLLGDEDLNAATDLELAKYEAQVLRRYQDDVRIQAWDLYWHPGERFSDKTRLDGLLHLLFRYARYEFPNQPVMATPVVKIKPFKENFNYHDAFMHGLWNGWNMFEYEGGATAELCALIWQLSDVISFSSNQSAGQTGWLKTVAFRYGRPIFCTQWQPLDEKNMLETLDNFSRSHIYWYQQGNLPKANQISNFEFQLINTPH